MINIEIQKALNFAAKKHREQTRKSTDIPYIVHPAECMQILTEMGCSTEIIVAGILHDTIEDTDTTVEELCLNFNKEVVDLVTSESEDKSKSWQERKSAFINKLKEDCNSAKIVCFADKLSNVRSIYRDYLEIGERVWDRFNESKDKEKWYYESLGEVFAKITLDNLNNDNARNLYKEYKELLSKLFDNLTE